MDNVLHELNSREENYLLSLVKKQTFYIVIYKR